MYVSKRFFRRGIYTQNGFHSVSPETIRVDYTEKRQMNNLVLFLFTTPLMIIVMILQLLISRPELLQEIRRVLFQGGLW